jgi:type II secretory pathway predicted ATPase ExeA
MFTQYFGMKINPFDKEIPVEDLFESADMKELDSRLKYLQNTRGMGLVVGEPGSGKSTVLRKYVRGLNHSLYKPCYMALSTLTVMDFYNNLAKMLGETPAFRKIGMYRQIQDSISSYYYDQKITPVIILDEMHLAGNAILEDLRLILSFRMDSSNPYILIIAGQPAIRNRLSLNVNMPLRQRLTVRHIMQGLGKDELDSYIKSRLKLAGAPEDIFLPEAIDQIHANTGGFPRPVNNLVVACLMYAAAKRQQHIDMETVYQAQKELNV